MGGENQEKSVIRKNKKKEEEVQKKEKKSKERKKERAKTMLGMFLKQFLRPLELICTLSNQFFPPSC